MARKRHSTISRFAAPAAVVLLLVLALTAGVAGCMGEEEASESMVSVVSSSTTRSEAIPVQISEEPSIPVEDFSTFESKDPFIQQVVPTTAEASSSTTIGGGNTPTSYTTTTRYFPTTTTWWTTTTRWNTTTTKWNTTTTTNASTTTTTKPPTTTTTKPPYAHSLSVLSVDEVGGEPACTFKVDGTIYKDKRVGDVVSTSWGQIQVVDIALSSKVVTLLQGSETIMLEEGETIYG